MEAAIAAQQAVLQQNIGFSVIKQAANVEKAIANMVDQATQNVPTGSRGGLVNISA
jgi:hypothetical protein